MSRNMRRALLCLMGATAVCVPPSCWAQTYTIATVAGGANPYFLSGAGDGGQATSAALGTPCYDVAVDGSGNLYISAGGLIRKVTAATGNISTIAGGGVSVGDGVPATQAALAPTAIAVDGSANIFIADTAFGIYRIRRIDATTGIITTVAGGGPCCVLGDGGSATSAYIAVPYDLALDNHGNLYIAQASTSNNLIRKVANGTITTVAGGSAGSTLTRPTGVAVDGSGNVYIADAGSNLVRELSNNTITTVAGNGTDTDSGDGGQATQAGIHAPWHVAVDAKGNIYITQFYDASVRWVAPGGTINTIASSGQVDIPAGVTTDIHGVVYVADDNPDIPTVKSLTAPGQAPSPVTTFSPAQGATGVSLTPALTWTAATGATSYDVYFGTSATPPFATNTAGTSYNPATLSANTTYYWYLVSKNASGSATSATWSFTIGAASSHPAFFAGEVYLSGIVYYLQFPNTNLFGYYEYLSSSILYHFDMGYEAFIPSTGGQIYFYDFASGHWWYTSPGLFPSLYDFTLNTWIYYFPSTTVTGHYTTSPRYFSNLVTGNIFTM
jgi:hypothetical protein